MSEFYIKIVLLEARKQRRIHSKLTIYGEIRELSEMLSGSERPLIFS